MGMTKEQIHNRQKLFRAWRESEIGKLFEAYDAATGNAWVVDTTSNSPSRLDQAWEQQRKAKAKFLAKLCDIAGVENPYAK